MIKPGSCLYAELTQPTYKSNTFVSAVVFSKVKYILFYARRVNARLVHRCVSGKLTRVFTWPGKCSSWMAMEGVGPQWWWELKNKIMCVLLIPIWKSIGTVMGSWGLVWCRLSTGITSCCEDASNKCLFLRYNCTCWSGRGFWTVQSTTAHQSVLLNQHVDMLHLSGGWIILCSPTDSNHCVLEIWQIFIL